MLMEKTLWIVVIDEKGAHIYKKSPHHQLHLMTGYPHKHTDHHLDVSILAAYLADAHSRKTFDQLALIAPHKLLGEIRPHLSHDVTGAILEELPKDLAHLSIHDLQEYLHKETRWF